MRHCLSLAAGLFLGAAPAAAGDFAEVESFGFSGDGKVYAFGQSGIHDGSGFPYADIFFVDLAADTFLAPSPIRIRLDEDGATLKMAKDKARQASAALFSAHAPEEHHGLLVVANPPTELSADPYRARFLPRAIEPSPDRAIEIRLEPVPLGPAAECGGMADAVYGFRLVKLATAAGEAAKVLHEDKTPPRSRSCAIDYRLSEVRVAEQPDGTMVGVVLVGVKSVGFEGPDLRTIAVPLALD